MVLDCYKDNCKKNEGKILPPLSCFICDVEEAPNENRVEARHGGTVPKKANESAAKDAKDKAAKDSSAKAAI